MTDLVFLIDQDGPLADFDPHFHSRCREEGWYIEVESHHHQTFRFATDHMPNEEERAAARAMVDTPGWFRDLPVVEGAQEGLAKLAEVPNSEVWICTKPLEANVTCRDDKAWWIEQHFGEEWVDRLILAPDKSLVQGHLLLDDAPKPEWSHRASWVPVIFPMNWNGAGSDWDGLLNWKWGDDLEILVEIAKSNAYYSSQRHVW